VFMLGGLFQITFYLGLQYVGLNYTTAANTALIVNTRPIFVGLLSALFLRESLGRDRITGMMAAFVGVAILTLGGAGGSIYVSGQRLLGDALIVLNAISGAVGIVILKRLLGRYSPLTTAVYTATAGMLGLLPLSAYEILSSGWPRGSLLAWGAVVYMGAMCTAVAFVAWYGSLSRLQASETSVFLFLTPLISVALSAVLLGEAVTAWLLLGASLIIVGAYLAVRPVHTPARSHA
jgi:drug/metabolite transporter (DMT)-like permease